MPRHDVDATTSRKPCEKRGRRSRKTADKSRSRGPRRKVRDEPPVETLRSRVASVPRRLQATSSGSRREVADDLCARAPTSKYELQTVRQQIKVLERARWLMEERYGEIMKSLETTNRQLQLMVQSLNQQIVDYDQQLRAQFQLVSPVAKPRHGREAETPCLSPGPPSSGPPPAPHPSSAPERYGGVQRAPRPSCAPPLALRPTSAPEFSESLRVCGTKVSQAVLRSLDALNLTFANKSNRSLGC